MSKSNQITQLATISDLALQSPSVIVNISESNSPDDEGCCRRLKLLHKESDGTSSFIGSLVSYLTTNSKYAYFWLCLKFCYSMMVIVWDFAMIVMGAIGINGCPVEPMIPIYLIVCGVVGSFGSCCFATGSRDEQEENHDDNCSVTGVIQTFIYIFLLSWLVLGCIWIFPSYFQVDFVKSQSPTYCDKNLYYFSFFTVLIQLGIVGFIMLICFSLLIFACIFGCVNPKH